MSHDVKIGFSVSWNVWPDLLRSGFGLGKKANGGSSLAFEED